MTIIAQKVAAGKEVFNVDFHALDGIGELDGEILRVKFEGRGDESDRLMFASQLTCTVEAEAGWGGTDVATVTDENGKSVSGTVSFDVPAVPTDED